MRIDFHSHILPEMDDGASDSAESVRLLKILGKSGVDLVVLTPHFYRGRESISSFLERREKSYNELLGAIEGIDGIPSLALGAEVYFYPSLSSDPDFEKLCIEDTPYLLLELPFERFYDNFFSEFYGFVSRCSCRIILAHIERYLTFGNTLSDLHRLLEMQNMLCQMNCSSLSESGFFKRKKLLGMLNDGMINVLGTDTHNLGKRPPRYKEAEKIIRSKCINGVFEKICSDSEKVFGETSADT